MQTLRPLYFILLLLKVTVSQDIDLDIYKTLFKSVTSPVRLRESLKYYTSKVGIAGGKGDYELAQWTASKFRECGLENVQIKEYYPLLNYPIAQSLQLLAPTFYNSTLTEKYIPEDSTSSKENLVPAFFGYGASGNVSAQLVYANFGTPKDFAALKSRGIDVRGKIVIVRYGSAFRGLKVRAAELNGAVGVIIYSDPKEDGFIKGPVYPQGPYRPPTSFQRGSVQYPNFYPGDPLTPGIPATENATRIPMEQAEPLPKIPAIPISYQDAEPFLKALSQSGLLASKLGPTWQGGLGFDYYTGPAALVHLYVNNSFEIKPIWNVIANITGTEEPDRALIVGNHRDAWVYGAVDPHMGSSALIEVACGLGFLNSNADWKPKRSIILASWDAEEYGLVGSTEWVEDNAELLDKKGAIYINMDTAVSGPHFKASASPSLSSLLRSVTKQVQDPKSGKSVYEEWLNHPWNPPHNPQAKSDINNETYIGPLGFGSDYVGFLQRLGIASMDIKFDGPYGVYHSNYDSFHWIEKFGDPTFEYAVTISNIVGLLLLELSELPILRFDFRDYAKKLHEYALELQDLLNESGLSISLDSLYTSIELYRVAAHRLQKEIHELENVKNEFNRNPTNGNHILEIQKEQEWIPISHTNKLKSLNDRIMYAERGFLDQDGIPERPWYKHIIYAPDEWAGYRAEMFPSIREGIQTRNVSQIQSRIHSASHIILLASRQLLYNSV